MRFLWSSNSHNIMTWRYFLYGMVFYFEFPARNNTTRAWQFYCRVYLIIGHYIFVENEIMFMIYFHEIKNSDCILDWSAKNFFVFVRALDLNIKYIGQSKILGKKISPIKCILGEIFQPQICVFLHIFYLLSI